MSDLLEKCTVCSALLDEEDLFCANCGTEAPNRARHEEAEKTVQATHNFLCGGCGAAMSYDASARTLRCPFCGSEKLEEQQDKKVLAPERVVPFAINQSTAIAIMRKWLGSSFWRPSDLANTAAVETMRAVYVPYWVFAAHTHTYWTADTSQRPAGASGDWAPLAGEHRGKYAGILIGASGALTAHETSVLCPFDLSQGLPPEQVDLENAVYEQFRVQRKYARPLAMQSIENLESDACSVYVPGRCRNLHVNVRLEGLSSEPVLLPVWIMAYRYQDRVFRFLANGQTGRATGEAPTDWWKIVLLTGAILLAVIVFIGMIALCSGATRGRASRENGPSAILLAAPNETVRSKKREAHRSHVCPAFTLRVCDSSFLQHDCNAAWPVRQFFETNNPLTNRNVTYARSG